MAKRSRELDFPFFQYLCLFYKANKGKIRQNFKLLSRKFLDYNDPESGGWLRVPQFEALEMYVFLKEYLDNGHLQKIFSDWQQQTGNFSGRMDAGPAPGQDDLFSHQIELDAKEFQKAFDFIDKFRQDYPNYIFALTMGTGKTILMATCIFYEFLLANKFPKDPRFCHNALVFAPDKTVLQSLKEIITFDKTKVVPAEYVNWLETNLQLHFLDNSGISLNTIDRSKFNIIITNTQKVILKKQHKKKTTTDLLFSDIDAVYKAKSLNKEFDDLYDFQGPGDDVELLENQRFHKLTRLEQLGVYVDEAHHLFGNKLAKDLGANTAVSSLRLTINELAKNLEEAGTHIVACYNYTGTPYAAGKLLPEVVYAYGLKDAIQNKYLKRVTINGFSNTKCKEFVKVAIDGFCNLTKDKKPEGMLPKLAFFASTIEELQDELRPAIEQVLVEKGLSIDSILVNVGDPKLTSNDDLREFINLDTISSRKQFILLVNKGKEGWNCRSLFGVALHRKPKSKIFVLQATMRCLRSIGNPEAQEKAEVYLSKENVDILQSELESNFRMTVEDLNSSNADKQNYKIKLMPPPVKIKLKRIKRLYQLKDKELKKNVDFEIEKIDIERYKVIKTERSLDNLKSRLRSDEDLTYLRERRHFSKLSLVAEVARYLNRSPLEVEKILGNCEDGLDNVLKRVNEFNELIYDDIIPKLFHELYDLDEFKKEEVEEIELVHEPTNDDKCYEITAAPNMVASLEDEEYKNFKLKSFHLDHYCFDSIPEKDMFWNLLNDGKITNVWFTGMLTHGQSDFFISYIDPASHTIRHYYPDFLLKHQDDSYTILEVKAKNQIDDTIVKAKAEYATQMAIENGMSYKIIPHTNVSKGLLGAVN